MFVLEPCWIRLSSGALGGVISLNSTPSQCSERIIGIIVVLEARKEGCLFQLRKISVVLAWLFCVISPIQVLCEQAAPISPLHHLREFREFQPRHGDTSYLPPRSACGLSSAGREVRDKLRGDPSPASRLEPGW